MDLATLAIIMLRRWYVVIAVLVSSAAFGVLIISQPAVRYETYSTDLLVERSQVEPTVDDSPTLSVAQLGSILASALRQPEFEISLRNEGFNGAVATSVSSDGGIVIVTVTGDDPNDVVETLREVTERAASVLDSVVGTIAADSVVVTPLSEPSESDIVETIDRYSAIGNVALLSLADTSNPFPPGGGTILMLTEISKGSDVVEALSIAVPSALHEVTGDPRQTAPLIRIDTTADTSSEAKQAIDVVRDQLNVQLEKLQSSAGVAAGDQTVIRPLVQAADAELTSASVVRPAAGVALLGLAAACAAAVAIDTMMNRRRVGRRRKLIEVTADEWVSLQVERSEEL